MAKWRAISSAHRSEGVHNFYQAIRQKAPPVDKTQAGKTAYKPIRPGRPAHIIDNSQGLVNRLYENGYIRPKMIRIRLLHYWICRLLGELSGQSFKSSLAHSLTHSLARMLIQLFASALFCFVFVCFGLLCFALFFCFLFCSVLFCSVLFCSVLFCSVLFCSVLFCSVLFCSVLFCSVLFCYLRLGCVQHTTNTVWRLGGFSPRLIWLDLLSSALYCLCLVPTSSNQGIR